MTVAEDGKAVAVAVAGAGWTILDDDVGQLTGDFVDGQTIIGQFTGDYVDGQTIGHHSSTDEFVDGHDGGRLRQ